MKFDIRDNVLIFCVCGKAGSGKSLVGKYLYDFYTQNNYKVIISPYTKYLKQYIKEITGKDVDEINKPRAMLQQLSSKLIKGKLGYNDLFINRQLEDISIYKYFFDIIIIPDVRFPNEIEILKKNFDNVFSIGVKRVNFDNGLSLKEKNDVTEISLDNYKKFDYNIENYGNEKLKIEVLNIIDSIEERLK